MTGIYFSSIVLVIVNVILCLIEFVGAIGGFNIVIVRENIIVRVAQSGVTRVFPELLSLEMQVSIGMIIVLCLGVLSIFPGLLMTRLHRLNQVQS